MTLYRKLFEFLKPHIKHIILSMFLTLCYVMLNNVSLWVSVDFIGELFPKSEVVETQADTENLVAADSTQVRSVQTDSGHLTNDTPHSKIKNVAHKVKTYTQIKKWIKKHLIRDTRRQTLLVVCIVIFISFVAKNIFDYLRRIINRLIQLKIVVQFRNQIQKSVIRFPLAVFDETHSGKYTSIMFNDVKAVRQVLKNSFGKMVMIPMQIITNIVILILISPKLSLITFLVIPISGIIIVKIGQSMRRKSRRAFRQISTVVSYFQESISAIRVVKAFTSEKRETEKFQEANQRYFKILFRAAKLGQATSPLNETCAMLILITLLWYGGNLVYSGEFDAEDFVRFLIFLFASLQPLRELSGLNNIIQRGLAASERIFKLIETPQEVYEESGSQKLEGFNKSIELLDVSFRYNSDGPDVLQHINLEIKKGETVAFVGHSGSGKTTMVSLIPRFYDVTSGNIQLDGFDLKEFTLSSLRKQISVVTQETMLFNESVTYNIAYGLENASEEQVKEAAKVANAMEFIEQMDEGFDTIIGERGVKLSGGQKQRLSIARAVLKNPPILILDEATSSLDTESERLVQDAIERIMKNRTVLVIAHRLSTVLSADKIVVLEEGKIVGMGKHSDILETCDQYQKLYKLQFADHIE